MTLRRVIVSAVVALGAGGCAGEARTLHSATAPDEKRSLSARIAIAGQKRLLTSRRVEVRLVAGGDVIARVGVAAIERVPGRRAGPRRPVSGSRRVTLRAGHPIRVVLPLTRRGLRALATCARHELLVRVGTGGGREQKAIHAARVTLDTPRCTRFFSPTGVWNARLPRDAPLDPTSSEVVAALRAQVDSAIARRYGPTINTHQYSAPVYEVPESQPRVRVTLDDQATYRRTLREALRSVPVPPDARAAGGTDAHMVVWQPSTDTLWEFWKMLRSGDGWHAKAAGRMRRVSRNPGYFAGPRGSPWGATATSLPLVGGLIFPEELKIGRIDHALALAIPRPRRGFWSLPAQRTDGFVDEPNAVPEGARFRIDPGVDLNALQLPPVIRAMAQAVQRYGMIVRDFAGTVAFYAEDPVSVGRNPYPRLFDEPVMSDLLAKFPWQHLQALKLNLRTYSQ